MKPMLYLEVRLVIKYDKLAPYIRITFWNTKFTDHEVKSPVHKGGLNHFEGSLSMDR